MGGFLSDRVSRRLLAGIGTALTAGIFLALGFTSSFTVVLATAVVSGLTNGACTALSRDCHPRRHGRCTARRHSTRNHSSVRSLSPPRDRGALARRLDRRSGRGPGGRQPDVDRERGERHDDHVTHQRTNTVP